MNADAYAPTFNCHADPKACAIVQTPSFRCLAYKDETGWHDAYHPEGPPLRVLRIQFLQDPSDFDVPTAANSSTQDK